MALTIDFANKIIYPDRADMTQIQSTPIEIYQLDLNSFHQGMRNLEDDEGGIWADVTHDYASPTTLSGVTYARLVEIINNYTVTFLPDSAWVVQVVGGNSNVGDRVNPNNVSVQVANSAGLQDAASLQAASFNGEVALKPSSSNAGTTFPNGTREFPVNNTADAIAICVDRGIERIVITESMTLSDGDFSAGYIFVSDNPAVVTLTLTTGGADVTNCVFENITVTGEMDGNSVFRQCAILDATSINGFLFECALFGTITLAGGAQSTIMQCYSGIPGGQTGAYPVINMGGSGQELALRAYSGGLGLINGTGAADFHSLDFVSGRLVVDNTVTAGNYTVRGIADVTNTSTATIDDKTLYKNLQGSAFGGYVFVDAANGQSGTVFPTGTRELPVDNVTDALAIASANGIDSLKFIGNYTFTSGDNISLLNISGQDSSKTTLTFPAGVVTAGTDFEECTIVGELISPTGFNRVIFGAVTGGTIGSSGAMNIRDCVFTDSITLSAALIADINIANCVTGVTSSGGPAIFDANGANVNLSIHGYSGEMEIRGFSNTSVSAEIHITGEVVLDSSNTAGSIEINGLSEVIDNSAGTTVVINSLDAHAANIGSKILRNKTVTDPSTGIMTVYDDDGVTPILTAQLYEDADGTQTYRGKGGERRERLA